MSIPSRYCSVNECGRDIVSTFGLCELHYNRKRKGQPIGSNTAYRNGKIAPSEIAFNRSEYNSWRSMKGRCYYKKFRAYHRYGGRGIVVCPEWLGREGFANFLKDMGKKPGLGYSLDRIDNDKNYCPENCKWSTQKEQVRNSSIVKYIETDNGHELLLDVLERNKISVNTYRNRVYNHGWDEVIAAITLIRARS